MNHQLAIDRQTHLTEADWLLSAIANEVDSLVHKVMGGPGSAGRDGGRVSVVFFRDRNTMMPKKK